MEKSYYDLLNEFYDLLQCNPLSSSAQLLYYTLLQINNKCGWTEWFQRTNVNICSITGISEKTLIKSKNELKQLGLIEFETAKKKGSPTKYKLIEILEIDCKMYSTNSSQSSSITSSVSSTPNFRHNKTKDKDKDKNIRSIASMNEDTPEVVPSRKKVVSIVPYEKIVSKTILK